MFGWIDHDIIMRLLAVGLGVILLMGAALAANVQCWNGTVGAVSWWTHDNADYGAPTTADKCGRNDLTDGNAPNTGQAGVFNEGYDYEKTNSDYIYNAVTDASLTPNGNISIVYWFEPESETNGDYIMQFGDSDGATPNHISHRYYGAGNEWIYQIRTSNADYRYYDDGDIQEIGDLYHVVIVWGDTNLTLYLNGTQRALSVTLQAGAIPDSANLNDNENFGLAAEWNDVAHAAFGDASLVDEVSIYNYSLTATEVSELFNNNRVGETASSAAYGEISDIFSSPIYETTAQDYNFSIWYNSTNISNPAGILNWNFTNYSPTSTGNSSSGDNVTIWWAYEDLPIPLVDANFTNVSTWWEYNITWTNATTHVLNGTNNTQAIYHAYYMPNTSAVASLFLAQNTDFFGTAHLTKLVDLADYWVTLTFNGTSGAGTNNTANNYSYAFTTPSIDSNNVTLPINGSFIVGFGGVNKTRTSDSNATMMVYRAALTDCSSGGAMGDQVVLNFTFEDEANFTDLFSNMDATFWVYSDAAHSVNYSSSFNFTDTLNATLCLYPANATVYVDSFQVYTDNGTAYRTRNYFLTNATLDNSTIENVTLYNILTTASDLLTLTITDELVAQPEVYVVMERYYPAENLYRAVEIGLTDEDGQTFLYPVPNDVYYRFLVIDDYTTIYSGDPREIGVDSFTIDVGGTLTLEYFDYANGVSVACNRTGNIIGCSLVNPTGLSVGAALLVRQIGIYTDTEICYSEVTTVSTTTMTCNISGYSGLIQADLMFIAPDSLLAAWSETFNGAATDAFGGLGLLISIMLIAGTTLLLAFSPALALIGAILGLLISAITGIAALSLGNVVLILIAGAFIIVKVRS